MAIPRIEAIQTFLKAKAVPDLAALYNPNMEVQVNVARDNGEAVSGTHLGKNWRAWTDHIQTWKQIRIPHNASTVPEYTDRKITFSLSDHAEAIGMTGWDWVNR